VATLAVVSDDSGSNVLVLRCDNRLSLTFTPGDSVLFRIKSISMGLVHFPSSNTNVSEVAGTGSIMHVVLLIIGGKTSKRRNDVGRQIIMHPVQIALTRIDDPSTLTRAVIRTEITGRHTPARKLKVQTVIGR